MQAHATSTTEEAPLAIPSISRAETLARQAYTSLRASIRSGAISANGFYSEVQLARALHISRTPVREALIELEREGLVEIVPQRGFRLRSIPDAERQEAFTLRILIETHVVRLLAADASDEDVTTLRAILDHQKQAVSNPAAFIDADEDFHLAMPTLLGLERTREILLTLRGITWLSGLDAISVPERVRAVLEEHRLILDRIAAHDPTGAAKAMRTHIDLTRRALKQGKRP